MGEDLQRFLIKGVWFYYNLDEDADSIYQWRFSVTLTLLNLDKFIEALETDLIAWLLMNCFQTL